MNMNRALRIGCLLAAATHCLSHASAADGAASGTQERAPAGACTSVKELQQEFLQLRFGMFIHFNLETFKGVQWVSGYHSPADFNPGGKVDTDAWADAAVSAGMKYAVLTAKHVSGFCLWELLVLGKGLVLAGGSSPQDGRAGRGPPRDGERQKLKSPAQCRPEQAREIPGNERQGVGGSRQTATAEDG